MENTQFIRGYALVAHADAPLVTPLHIIYEADEGRGGKFQLNMVSLQ